MRRWMAASAALMVAIFLPGCGGAGNSNAEPGGSRAILTPAAVKRCILEGGEELRYAAPVVPKSSPLYAEAIYGIGPAHGHVGVVLSLKPTVTRRLVRIYNRRHEFHAEATRDARAIMLLDFRPEKADRELVIKCAEGS